MLYLSSVDIKKREIESYLQIIFLLLILFSGEKLNLQITIDTAAGSENVDKLNNKTKESVKSAKEGQGAFSSLAK